VTDRIVAAASTALGEPLTDPVDLGGGSRSTVLCCTRTDGRTVIVKAYAGDTFPAESTGLAFADRTLPGIRRAAAYWTVDISVALARRAADADRPMHSRRTSPGMRQLPRHRWADLVAELTPTGELPALAEAFGGLLAATEQWDAEPLPPYPAFAGSVLG